MGFFKNPIKSSVKWLSDPVGVTSRDVGKFSTQVHLNQKKKEYVMTTVLIELVLIKDHHQI